MNDTVTLKKNYEFLRLYKKGRYFVGKYIIIYVYPNNYGRNRIGITVSKKVGKAVVRNRVKRIIRENYRFYEPYIKTGNDFVFVARTNVDIPKFKDIKKELKYLLKKLEVFNQEKWDMQKDSL